MYIEGITLNCIAKIGENRSIFGIYHLITGKKSIQSVHDARIFQVEKYYGIYQTLSRQQFISIINKMTDNEWIVKDMNEGFYHLSSHGKEILEQYFDTNVYHYLDGLTYSGKDNTFIERLYLLVQTYSNVLSKNPSFIPIIDNDKTTNWVKTFFRKNRNPKIAIQIFYELHGLLKMLTDVEAEIFVDRLSGYNYYGLSKEQIATKHELSKDDVHVILTAITHKLIGIIIKKRESFEILSQLTELQNNNKFITNTANETYQLLMHNFSISDIAIRRNLKMNTIYDHIVEIALYDTSFDIEAFVTKREQEEVIEAVKVNKTLKLKTIKEHCDPSITYFQIRLVLTRLNKLLPEGQFHV
jgi:uncharacterized protein YpbB